MDYPNFNTLFQIARNEALVRNRALSRDAIEREGSDANILTASACAAADQVVGQLTVTSAGLFIASAAGDALDRLLFDRYGLTRKVAAAAVGSVKFSVTTPLVAPLSIPAGTQIGTSDGITFETVEAALFPAATTELYVGVRSLLAGANQQARVGTLNNLLTPLTGSPTDLVVTNPIATTGAADRESDASFRARGQSYYTSLQKGTLTAITQGALSVPGVASAQTIEVLDAQGQANKRVLCVITDQFTDALANYSSVPPVYQAQSQQLAQTVFNALEAYRPAGIFVNVQVAQVVLVPVSLALSFKAGANINAVAVNARAAVVNYINSLAPGDELYLSPLLNALQGVDGLNLTGYEIASPPVISGTSQPLINANPLQVLRTSLSIVQATSSNPGTPIGNYFNVDQIRAS